MATGAALNEPRGYIREAYKGDSRGKAIGAPLIDDVGPDPQGLESRYVVHIQVGMVEGGGAIRVAIRRGYLIVTPGIGITRW